MKRKLMAFVLSIAMLLSMTPCAFASESGGVAELVDKNNNTTVYSSVEELNSPELTIGQNETLRLLTDVTLSSTDGYCLNMYGGGNTLDLNGYTLTISGSPSEGVFVGIMTDFNSVIKNGKILINMTSDESIEIEMACAIYRMGYSLEMDQVEIAVGSGATLSTAIFASATQGKGNLTLTNCVIGDGTESAIAIDPEWNLDDSDVVVVSGNYTNLYSTTDGSAQSPLPTHVSTQTGSSALASNPEGVTEGTTVITSSATTAIIVQDGKAYTYDTLQDALDASAARATTSEGGDAAATILLVKQPEETAKIPDNAPNLTIKALDESDSSTVNVNQIELTTDGGGTVTLDGDGNVKISAPAPAPTPAPATSSRDSITVRYLGGNEFGTSKSAKPDRVEIDGVSVPFYGDGSRFSVSSLSPNARWITVHWGSTSVTVNFTPDGQSYSNVVIPKTGDMPIWAAIAAFFGF